MFAIEPAELCRYAELPARLDAAAQRHRMHARHGWCLGKFMGKYGYGVMDGYGKLVWYIFWSRESRLLCSWPGHNYWVNEL